MFGIIEAEGIYGLEGLSALRKMTGFAKEFGFEKFGAWGFPLGICDKRVDDLNDEGILFLWGSGFFRVYLRSRTTVVAIVECLDKTHVDDTSVLVV